MEDKELVTHTCTHTKIIWPVMKIKLKIRMHPIAIGALGLWRLISPGE